MIVYYTLHTQFMCFHPEAIKAKNIHIRTLTKEKKKNRRPKEHILTLTQVANKLILF